MEVKMSNNGKQKDFGLWVYDPNSDKAIKLDFSGNISLTNGAKGTILGVKGSSKDGSKRFLRIFAQVGTLWRQDDGKFTGQINYPDAGGNKGLIAWLNDSGTILSGYKNEPRKDANKKQDNRQQAAPF